MSGGGLEIGVQVRFKHLNRFQDSARPLIMFSYAVFLFGWGVKTVSFPYLDVDVRELQLNNCVTIPNSDALGWMRE